MALAPAPWHCPNNERANERRLGGRRGALAPGAPPTRTAHPSARPPPPGLGRLQLFERRGHRERGRRRSGERYGRAPRPRAPTPPPPRPTSPPQAVKSKVDLISRIDDVRGGGGGRGATREGRGKEGDEGPTRARAPAPPPFSRPRPTRPPPPRPPWRPRSTRPASRPSWTRWRRPRTRRWCAGRGGAGTGGAAAVAPGASRPPPHPRSPHTGRQVGQPDRDQGRQVKREGVQRPGRRARARQNRSPPRAAAGPGKRETLIGDGTWDRRACNPLCNPLRPFGRVAVERAPSAPRAASRPTPASRPLPPLPPPTP